MLLFIGFILAAGFIGAILYYPVASFYYEQMMKGQDRPLAYVMITIIFGLGIGAYFNSLYPAGAFLLLCIVAATKAHTRAETMKKAIVLIDVHTQELRTKRRRMVVQGSYGTIDQSAWDKEVRFFLDKVLKVEDLSDYGKLAKRIEEVAAGEVIEAPRAIESPLDYEQFVAEVLRNCGWDASVTKASGDQGIDVIARREGKRLVVQCKLYSRPIGNAAVQEVIAGRAFEAADFAAVVSNQSYTPAARQLAAASQVVLIHHDDIPALWDRLHSLEPLSL